MPRSTGELTARLGNAPGAVRPFDGLVFDPDVGPRIFTETPYPDAAFARDRLNLASTDYGRLVENFVRVQGFVPDESWSWLSEEVEVVVRQRGAASCG